jgi:fatty acid desaturase
MEQIIFKKPLNIGIWLLALAGDYVLLIFSFWIASRFGWPAYPFSVLLLGITQHRLSVLGHEGAHGLICRNKKLNFWLAQIFCFWPLMIDIRGYREFHWEHHRHTGESGIDPELPLKEGHYNIPPMSKARFYRGFILDLFGASVVEFVNVVAYFTKRSNPIWPLSFVLIFGTLSFVTGHPSFFILFMISKPTSFWAVFRMRVYMEHVGTDETHRVHLNLFQRALFAPHNIWIHWEHHRHPFVPYYQLPDVRAHYKEVPIVTFHELLFKPKNLVKAGA